MAEGDYSAAAPVFKKRGKAAFKRKHSSSSEEGEEQQDRGEGQAPQLSVAEILRQRKQGRIRRVGAGEVSQARGENVRDAVVGGDRQESDVDRMKNRFVPQTGQVVDTYDKQMNDYIEAKMAEFRRQNGAYTTAAAGDLAPDADAMDVTTSNPSSAMPHKPDKQSVTAGRLMEVDLGDSLSRHEEEAAAKAGRPVKVRLGRDGKPWRPRKRRNSENLARDALVDSILKETALSRFQDSTPAPTSNAGKDEYVDEETVLQNFKSNYEDPMRRDARRPAKTTTGKQKQEPSKGPKLGGSKNARRAMMEENTAGKKT